MIHSFFDSRLHFCPQKPNDSLTKQFGFRHVVDSFLLLFPFVCPRANCSPCCSHCRSFLKSNHEQFARVALYKLATGAICSWERVNHYFALSLTKNERIAPKTKERIPNPGSDLLFS